MSGDNDQEAADAPLQPVASSAEHMDRFPDHRVLVVDDNKDLADAEAWLLKLCGQTVRQAYDGPSALRVATEFDPDIVFVDLVMPGMDGMAVARKMRNLYGAERPKIVALTGFGQPAFRDAAGAAGFDGYITKPASTIDFLEYLRS
jgi:CheY-like chemotaxis protein